MVARVCVFLASALAGVVELTACGPTFGTVTPVTTECILPDDQASLYLGRWDTVPIPIAFEAGAWDDSEMADILDAADTWNAHFQAVYGFDIFDYGSRAEVNTTSVAKAAQICTTGIVSGSGYSGTVAIYKQGTWPYTSMGNVIALTTSCPAPASPVNRFYMAVMEVNYQGFFTEGNEVPDLNTTMLHEFGHLLGLRHSCSEDGEDGFPTCENPDYEEAVMYPIVYVNLTKRVLKTNDQGRANCLYEGYTSSGTE